MMPKAATAKPETANLQKARFTVRDAARLMNVSERSVYMARRLELSGRQDVIDQVKAGKLTLHAALQIVESRVPPTRYEKLCRAWNNTSEEDRERFLVAIWPAPDSN